jgi:hypothetical protein
VIEPVAGIVFKRWESARDPAGSRGARTWPQNQSVSLTPSEDKMTLFHFEGGSGG